MYNLFSIAMYVLQALGFYTIAKRRGIRHAWLAWVPFGSAWILGCISDDYKSRCTGKKQSLRIALLVLAIAVAVFMVATVATSISMLLHVLTVDEVIEFGTAVSGYATDLYAPTEEELVQRMTEILDARLTDAKLETVLSSAMTCLAVSVVLMGVAIAMIVIECICMFNLFESCDPANKLVFFLVGMFVGIWGVFVFVVRNKDLGMPQATQLPPTQEPWQ